MLHDWIQKLLEPKPLVDTGSVFNNKFYCKSLAKQHKANIKGTASDHPNAEIDYFNRIYQGVEEERIDEKLHVSKYGDNYMLPNHVHFTELLHMEQKQKCRELEIANHGQDANFSLLDYLREGPKVWQSLEHITYVDAVPSPLVNLDFNRIILVQGYKIGDLEKVLYIPGTIYLDDVSRENSTKDIHKRNQEFGKFKKIEAGCVMKVVNMKSSRTKDNYIFENQLVKVCSERGERIERANKTHKYVKCKHFYPNEPEGEFEMRVDNLFPHLIVSRLELEQVYEPVYSRVVVLASKALSPDTLDVALKITHGDIFVLGLAPWLFKKEWYKKNFIQIEEGVLLPPFTTLKP